MNFIIVETPEHKEMFKQVVMEHTTISKIEAVNSGIIQVAFNLLELSVNDASKHLISWLAIDDDGVLLGVEVTKLGEKVPCWYSKISFVSKLGRERYGVNAMFFKAWEFGFKYAESRGYYELYYSQRIGRYRIMENMMKSAPFLKDYIIDVVEQVAPFSHSKNPLVRTHIHGLASGLNPRPLVIARIYNPDKIKYDYPYASQN